MSKLVCLAPRMSLADEMPGVTITALGVRERTLVWVFRALSCGACPARLAAGLATIVTPGEAFLAGEALAALLARLQQASRRSIEIAPAPARGLTWDEAALLALMAATRADSAMMALWLRRLGIEAASVELRASLDWAAAMLARSSALPDLFDLAMLGPIQPVSEPEVLLRSTP